jgi:molybdopterin synthase sulfur carrier subunit
MATTVRVPGPLRRLTGGNAEVTVDGETVGAVLTNLDATYPGFHDRLYDDSGSLRQFINIYVNDSDIRFAQGLDTPIAERDEVSIVPAVAGGGGPR